MAQEADGRADAVRREAGRQGAAEVRRRDTPPQPLRCRVGEALGLAYAEEQVTVCVAQGQQHPFRLGEFGGGDGNGDGPGFRLGLGFRLRLGFLGFSRFIGNRGPAVLGWWVGKVFLSRVFCPWRVTDRPLPRPTDRRRTLTRYARVGPTLAGPGRLVTREGDIGEELFRDPAAPRALLPPLVQVTAVGEELLGLLVGPALQTQSGRVLAERLGGGGLGVGEPLYVQQQNLRVAVEPRVPYDVVRSLRVAPNRRDSMPKHLWWTSIH